MAMRRTYMDGKVVNIRTAEMIKRAEARLGYDLRIVQGSYNAGVIAASAGTHDGGGAVDFSTSNIPNIKEAVRQLRLSGFAAWHRTPAQGPWTDHIHAIAIGDDELSSGARFQVWEYYAGRNGLASRGADDGPRVDPIPVWYISLKEVSVKRVVWQFKAEKKRKLLGVKRIQRLLNYRLGTDLREDGIAGPKTVAAYKRWEERIDSPEPNGIPGAVSLRKLFAGYYRVVK